ncbi:MAG: hypothetical protein K0U29_02380 [Gammaproteobacteria bacterium]|nr:hypothetical protein [Gammaproteobacteria bacterium]
MKRKQSGISLLEILLGLVLIATISTMAIRYFTVTTRSMKVSNAIKQIKHLSNISYEWLQQQQQTDFSGSSAGTRISLQELINTGLLRNDPSERYDPWGGDITVNAATNDPSYVSITLSKVPQDACRMMVRQLQSVNHLQSTPCGSAYGNTFSGEF